MEEGNKGRSHSLASECADLESEMSGVRNGTQLRETVASVLHQLPKGALAIFSTSDEGGHRHRRCGLEGQDHLLAQDQPG